MRAEEVGSAAGPAARAQLRSGGRLLWGLFPQSSGAGSVSSWAVCAVPWPAVDGRWPPGRCFYSGKCFCWPLPPGGSPCGRLSAPAWCWAGLRRKLRGLASLTPQPPGFSGRELTLQTTSEVGRCGSARPAPVLGSTGSASPAVEPEKGEPCISILASQHLPTGTVLCELNL